LAGLACWRLVEACGRRDEKDDPGVPRSPLRAALESSYTHTPPAKKIRNPSAGSHPSPRRDSGRGRKSASATDTRAHSTDDNRTPVTTGLTGVNCDVFCALELRIYVCAAFLSALRFPHARIPDPTPAALA
jgi:hypothetical protein